MNAALEGVSGQQHAPAALYHRERPGNQFTWSLVGPMAGLGGRKNSSPTGFDPGPSSPFSVAIPTELLDPLHILHTHTGLVEMIVGVLTICHNMTQSFCYIPHRCSICAPFVILQISKPLSEVYCV